MRDHFHFDPTEVAVDAVGGLDAEGRALHVEVGFGKDVRILREAGRDREGLYLGIEVSRKKAESFCRKVARAGLRNVCCHLGDVRPVLESLAPGSVASFTILFPDPWPKRRHHKHRWIQDQTAARLAAALLPRGTIIVATDHDGYGEQIRTVLASSGLDLEYESREVPEEDRSLFAQRFERSGETVTYQRWSKSQEPQV